MTTEGRDRVRDLVDLGLALVAVVAVLVVDLTTGPDGGAQAAYLLPVLLAARSPRTWVLWTTAGAAVAAHAAALVLVATPGPVVRGLVLAVVAVLLVVVLDRRRVGASGTVATDLPTVPVSRRAFDEMAQRALVEAADVAELARLAPLADAPHEPLGTGLLLADLDLLPELTDVHGQAAAEAAVAHVAAVLRAAVRPGDTVARLGASSLAVLMPGVGPDAVRPRAEALRRVVRDTPLRWEAAELQVSISVGAAHTAAGHLDLPSLHAAAHEALVRAQADGRDRVVEP